MGRHCAALGCNNNDKKGRKKPGVTFHGFPLKKPQVLKSWLVRVGRQNFRPTENCYLCSEHFTETDFEQQPFTGRRQLRYGAVPSKFKSVLDKSPRRRRSCDSGLYQRKKDCVKESTRSAGLVPLAGMMATVQPSNNSELQLYRVLQRANLLQYFETFITQGGDDVQQLCEAGEDEFLEIMALVGMASKPLHVRRLQKALQEWVANPAAFEIAKKYPTHVMSMTGSASQNMSPTHPLERSNSLQDFKVTPPQSSTISTSTPWSSQTGPRGVSPSEGSNLDDPSSSSSPQGDFKDIMKDVLYNQEDGAYVGMMNMTQPVLLEHQITAIATAAAILAQELPPFEPKSMPKKQMSKEITAVMLMSADDPNRMDALRKYAAIYGRFDSKRKNDRPMSLHEISVNEAAAQLCSHFPALLTRREELFPLARQVVRESGYQYSKGHSRAAEVLVQPKLEQGEALPSTSSMSPMSQESTFHELQAELTQITTDLSEMAKEQDRIRSALRVLLEANDHEQMKALTAEMDDLNDRQAAMTKKRQRIVNSIAKYRKGASKYSVPTACLAAKSSSKMSPPQGLPSSKPVGTNSKYGNSYNFHDDPLPSNPLNTLYMAAMHNHKDSLFEEGLRIATQYGMSDFAQELIGMKSTKDDDPGVKVSGEGGAAVYNGFPPSSSPPSSSPPVVASASLLPDVAISTSLGNHTLSSSVSSTSSPTANGNVLSKSRPKSVSPTTTTSSNKTHHTTSNGSVSVADHPASVTTTPSSNTSGEEPMDSATADHSNDGGKSASCSDKQNTTSTIGSSPESTPAQGSMTTTTTITTKSGQVIEVETRRSSRRKNGEPDYYLINGGEKRFRSSNNRRSSSTSSERARRLSSSSSTSSMTSSTPTSTTPVKQSKPDTQTNGDSIIRMNPTDLRFRNGEIQKVILNVNQSGDRPDGVDTAEDAPAEDRVYSSGDSEKRVMRKKGRAPSYTGQKLLIEDYSQ